MRSLIIIFSFVFSTIGFSQDTLATVLTHNWAAGQCCSSGMDITFTLSDKLTPSDFDSLVYISSGNSRTVFYPADFQTQASGEKRSWLVRYGWNSGTFGERGVSSTTVGYGLPENRFSMVTHQPAHLLIYKKSGNPKQAFVREEFTETVYP